MSFAPKRARYPHLRRPFVVCIGMHGSIHRHGGPDYGYLQRRASHKPVGLPQCVTEALRQLSRGQCDRWCGLSRPDVVRRDLMPGMIPARQREAVLEIFQTELPGDERALLGQVRRNLLPGNLPATTIEVYCRQFVLSV